MCATAALGALPFITSVIRISRCLATSSRAGWEAVYILDGLLKNLSALRPHTLFADTHAG